MTGEQGPVFNEVQLEQQLQQARASLVQVRDAVRPEAPADVTAEAADGLVQVTLGGAGLVTELSIDPRALRLGSEELADQVRAAVNDVLEQRAASTATAEPMPDLDAMTAVVERLQDESLRQMREITQGVTDTMRRLHGGGR